MSELRCVRCSQIPSCGCAEYLQRELSQEQARSTRLEDSLKRITWVLERIPTNNFKPAVTAYRIAKAALEDSKETTK